MKSQKPASSIAFVCIYCFVVNHIVSLWHSQKQFRKCMYDSLLPFTGTQRRAAKSKSKKWSRIYFWHHNENEKRDEIIKGSLAFGSSLCFFFLFLSVFSNPMEFFVLFLYIFCCFLSLFFQFYLLFSFSTFCCSFVKHPTIK